MIVFGYLMNDNYKMKLKVKEQDLIIVKLENKITNQQTELNLLAEDNNNKKEAIASLEERVRTSSLAAQEAVDRLIELANIERDVIPSEGPNIVYRNNPVSPVSGGQVNQEETSSTIDNSKEPNSAAGNENKKPVEVVNEPSSKKFVNLRNDIYSRYK
jgi:hypothetical protein